MEGMGVMGVMGGRVKGGRGRCQRWHSAALAAVLRQFVADVLLISQSSVVNLNFRAESRVRREDPGHAAAEHLVARICVRGHGVMVQTRLRAQLHVHSAACHRCGQCLVQPIDPCRKRCMRGPELD